MVLIGLRSGFQGLEYVGFRAHGLFPSQHGA